MFEFIRNHQRWMYAILLILIVPSFVLVGVSSYSDKGADANTVATVDGQKITQQEWDNAQRAQLERYRQAMGDKFDQKLLDTPEAKQATLDSLINDRVINAEIARNHLTLRHLDGTDGVTVVPAHDNRIFDDVGSGHDTE